MFGDPIILTWVDANLRGLKIWGIFTYPMVQKLIFRISMTIWRPHFHNFPHTPMKKSWPNPCWNPMNLGPPAANLASELWTLQGPGIDWNPRYKPLLCWPHWYDMIWHLSLTGSLSLWSSKWESKLIDKVKIKRRIRGHDHISNTWNKTNLGWLYNDFVPCSTYGDVVVKLVSLLQIIQTYGLLCWWYVTVAMMMTTMMKNKHDTIGRFQNVLESTRYQKRPINL